MHYFQHESVVLNKRDIRESARLFTLFTKEKGIITAHAEGVRKIISKLGGKLEVLNHISVSIHEHHSGKITITDVQSITPHIALKNSQERLNTALACCKHLLKFLPRNQSFPSLYIDFLHLLGVLSLEQDHHYYFLQSAFLLKILTYIDIVQPLHYCVLCLRKPAVSDTFYFEFSHKGLFCDVCLKKHASISADHCYVDIPFSMIKLLSFSQKATFFELKNILLDTMHNARIKIFIEKLLLDVSSSTTFHYYR